jgi:hypothetical protein
VNRLQIAQRLLCPYNFHDAMFKDLRTWSVV